FSTSHPSTVRENFAATLRDSAQSRANAQPWNYLASAAVCNIVKTCANAHPSITNQLLYQLSYCSLSIVNPIGRLLAPSTLSANMFLLSFLLLPIKSPTKQPVIIGKMGGWRKGWDLNPRFYTAPF